MAADGDGVRGEGRAKATTTASRQTRVITPKSNTALKVISFAFHFRVVANVMKPELSAVRATRIILSQRIHRALTFIKNVDIASTPGPQRTNDSAKTKKLDSPEVGELTA